MRAGRGVSSRVRWAAGAPVRRGVAEHTRWIPQHVTYCLSRAWKYQL